MALFNFGKKKEEKKAPACCCSSEAKAEEITPCCCGKPVEGICCIKVLGAGCKSCQCGEKEMVLLHGVMALCIVLILLY